MYQAILWEKKKKKKQNTFHFSAVFHIFESTQTLVFMHTYRGAKVLQPHTHTPQATANLLPRSMKRDLHCDAIL